jgi:hypothetical protein
MADTSVQFLVKFFRNYLPFTPTARQLDDFTSDLSLVSPYLMEAALVELKEGKLGRRPEVAADWRPALFKVYNRKVAEHAQLFGLFHSFETAFRSTVAVTLERHYRTPRWWRPIYDEMLRGIRARTVRQIGAVAISSDAAHSMGEIIFAIDGLQFQRNVVGRFGNGFQFVESCDLQHIARLIEDHWTVFAPRFVRGGVRLSLEHFKAKFRAVREARNDVYHHKSVARMTDVVFHAEDLLDYLNYSLNFVCDKISNASPAKPKFALVIEVRHRTW